MSYPIFTCLARTAISGLLGLPIPAPNGLCHTLATVWCIVFAVLVRIAGVDFGVSVLSCTACILVQFHFPARMNCASRCAPRPETCARELAATVGAAARSTFCKALYG